MCVCVQSVFKLFFVVSVCFVVTPQDYQPPGFKEADSDMLVFEKEPVKLTMGEVVTPYHTLKLDMATEKHRLEQVNNRAAAHLNFTKCVILLLAKCLQKHKPFIDF